MKRGAHTEDCCSQDDLFSCVETAPPDPILGIKQLFTADPRAKKADLSVGVYLDEDGQTANLKAVRQAETIIYAEDRAAGYIPMEGLPEYCLEVQKLIFGAASDLIAHNRLATVQTLGGTGALRVGAEFLHRHFPHSLICISHPSWVNHRAIFKKAGCTVSEYDYYDPNSCGLDFERMAASIEALPKRSIILLHACCHNPTGVDLSLEQWQEILRIVCCNKLIPFFDFAYQGFAEGLEEDARPIRLFADAGVSCIVASSLSKNFSLYRRRTGALTVTAHSADSAGKVLSQIKKDIRANYSSPPYDGGALAALVLSNKTLRAQWALEVSEMRERIKSMRSQFVEELKQRGAANRFNHILAQRGMFSYSGLTAGQVERLKTEWGVYAVCDGRICIAAMSKSNVAYIAKAVAAVSAE